MHTGQKLLSNSVQKCPLHCLKGLQIFETTADAAQVLSQTLFLSLNVGFQTHTKQHPNWYLDLVCHLLLIICNGGYWCIDMLTKSSYAIDLIPNDYYPDEVWAFITEITFPFWLFFRFHSLILGISMVLNYFAASKTPGEGRRT